MEMFRGFGKYKMYNDKRNAFTIDLCLELRKKVK